MKMVKSLLLGTAAGVVAVAGAQAADLPVKARPVQYVKICTLYGDGYYYIPGSDTCIKFGGYIQEDLFWNGNGSGGQGLYGSSGGAQDRSTSGLATRVRARFAVDTRTQTQYGTLRTLAAVTWQNQNQTESFNLNRAFIQFSGFTFGRIQSFSDVWSLNDSYNLAQQQTGSDTGANGINSIDYTWELGNGATFTVGADERRTSSLSNLSIATTLKVGTNPVDNHEGEVWPDFIADFRIDQAWGYWAFSGAVHNVNADPYTTTGAGVGNVPGFTCGGTTVGVVLTPCGHASDQVGWALLTGGEVKLPQFGPGDRAGMDFRYAVGASTYGGGNNVGNPAIDLFDGNSANFSAGWMTDGVYTNGSGIQLTTTWSVQAGYDHHWNSQWNTAVFGGYTTVQYNQTASQMFSDAVGCTATGAVSGAAPIGAALKITGSNCSPNWQFLEAGIRTNYTIAPGFYIGGQIQYDQVWGAFAGDTFTTTTNQFVGFHPAGTYNLSNVGMWEFLGRIYRAWNID